MGLEAGLGDLEDGVGELERGRCEGGEWQLEGRGGEDSREMRAGRE